MKSLITGLGLTVILIVCTILQTVICSYGLKEHELSNAMNNAVVETQRTLLYGNSIGNNDQYADYFVSALKQYTKSKGHIKVEIFSADFKKGLLDVEVSSQFVGYNKKKYITMRRTSIVDELIEEKEAEMNQGIHIIRYDIDPSISLNMTGMISNKKDKEANILYEIEDDFSTDIIIKINAGTIHQVMINNQKIDYFIADGYLIIPIDHPKTDLLIKVK